MVKGNWERRAELAAKRRDENRKEKIQKKLKIPSIESIINKLLNNKNNTINDIIICWLYPLDELNNNDSYICKQWFRYGNCSSKKCKLNHKLYDDNSNIINENNIKTFSDLINVSSYNDKDEEDTLREKTCLLPVLLSSIHIKDSNRIRFIAFNNTLVYDSLDFDFWNEYNSKQKNDKNDKNDKELFIINEEEGDDDEDNNNINNNIKVDDNNEILINNFNNMKINNVNYLIICKSYILSEILSYLSYTTIINLISTSKYFKQFCMKDESIRKLKKELFSSLSSTISKNKKDNKKKLLKNSSISKKDKKEGFKIKFCVK